MASTRNHSWDCTLPGPPSRSNGGSVDLSPAGLLAFATGSSVAVVDPSSMQLVSVLSMPPPSSLGTSLPSPFVTSVRWTPQPLRRDLLTHEPSTSHLLLAAGDRQGRIALFDFRLRMVVQWFEPSDSHAKLGIQDLCWIRSRSGLWILAALSGPSLLSLHSITTGRCFWKYDSSPEFFSSIRRDPFDWRHFCVLGLRGFLLSVMVLGDTKDDILVKELQIRTDSSELQKLERDASNGLTSSSSSPALAMFPLYSVKFSFSPQWKHILFAIFPRELVTFDLQYETSLSSASLPRGSSNFLDVLPDSSNELLYCVHLDGNLSTWKRKEGEQAHVMCMMEELIPSIGTTVPCHSILAVTICQSDSTLQNVGKIYSDVEYASSPILDFDTPLDFWDEPLLVSKTHLVSISNDGTLWNWLLTAKEPANSPKIIANLSNASDVTEVHVSDSDTISGNISGFEAVANPAQVNSSSCQPANIYIAPALPDKLFGICLIGQLQLLSSSITMLAVPTPSLTATLARGGNLPAVAVPLVALGTQTGIIDVVDVTANAVAASFAVHNSVIRGLRFLGNSRLVSFSYTQANEKTGGYVSKLVVTCLRTGLNRPFRVLQKSERAPVRALRASSSGRYLLILFRDAPVEVWTMTKSPIMLRSLALPFTVLEWTLPTAPCRSQNEPSMQSSISKDPTSLGPIGPSSETAASSADLYETTESFAFALVNGALGVFEIHGRRIRDFRPKWPSSSFVSSDGLVTAMAYRLPHVVMGDRSGNIRWWDVTTGHSSSFNTHREGIRRIKFSPVISGDVSRGRIVVLFNDNTFSVFDLDSQDPLANSLLQPQFPGTLGLEIDWLPLRTDKNDPLILCIAGADGSFRLLEVNIIDKKIIHHGLQSRAITERFRPMPLCLPILLPTPHALALRMILQLGVKPSWFIASRIVLDKNDKSTPGLPSPPNDLRSYMIELPTVGDSVVPEMLLKVLEPYRRDGCILDDEKLRLYSSLAKKGCAGRLAFAAALFGETSEAFFWLQLPRALHHLMNVSVNKSPQKLPMFATVDDTTLLSRIPSKGKAIPETRKRNPSSCSPLKLMAFEKEELRESASERILWHEKLEGEAAIQNRVHELVSIGNLEGAVNLLLSTSPDSSFFYTNALRAVALSSAVSKSLLELAVKVVAANMVRTDKSLSGIHLLCAVGRYQEACSQLQDAGWWTDAATLAATHLKGTDYSRVLVRWGDHMLRTESNMWRALILYVAGGAVAEALGALREAQLPDTAAMFVAACTEIQNESVSHDHRIFLCPGNADVIAVGEYYAQYQRKLVHLCMDSIPLSL